MESLTPAATEDERRVLGHILDGQTDSQIAESFGTDPRRIAATTTARVDRLTRALYGEDIPPSTPDAGRHRRQD
jgi:hypothetical protein